MEQWNKIENVPLFQRIRYIKLKPLKSDDFRGFFALDNHRFTGIIGTIGAGLVSILAPPSAGRFSENACAI